MNDSAAAELARRIMHLDALARLHVGVDVTTHALYHEAGYVVYTITRPCGTDTQIVARGNYDRCIEQLVWESRARTGQ